MKQKIKWLCGFISLSVIMAGAGVALGNLEKVRSDTSTVSLTENERKITVVIDAGHGGEDGGCIGSDGTLEKELNLSVARELYDILEAAGIEAAMTRADDTMVYDLYDDLDDYSGVKKTYDLKNRVRFAKESECLLFVSIHMNKFSESEYSGLQVYYSPNDSDSITSALSIQEHIKNYLEPDNEREIKRAGSNIYVLHRSQMPAVLIECGFLSNPEDLDNMKDKAYQRKMALCIAAAICDALSDFQT